MSSEEKKKKKQEELRVPKGYKEQVVTAKGPQPKVPSGYEEQVVTAKMPEAKEPAGYNEQEVVADSQTHKPADVTAEAVDQPTTADDITRQAAYDARTPLYKPADVTAPQVEQGMVGAPDEEMDMSGVMNAEPDKIGTGSNAEGEAVADAEPAVAEPNVAQTDMNEPRTAQTNVGETADGQSDTTQPVNAEKPAATEQMAEKPASTEQSVIVPDQNFMEAVKQLPEDEQRDAIANYLANGGPRAYQDYMNSLRYVETPEQQDAREEKERKNRMWTGIANMVGALGNFAVAGSNGAYGRSVPVADTVAAQNAGYTEARARRDKNLAQARDLGAKYNAANAGIIQNGYKNAMQRKKLQQDYDLKLAQQQMSAAINQQKASAYEANIQSQIASRERQDAIKQGMFALDAEKTRAATQKYYAEISRIKNKMAQETGGSVSEKTHATIISPDGTTYVIPKAAWGTENIAKVWSLLPQEIREEALKSITCQMSKEDAQVAYNDIMNVGASSKKWITANAEQMKIVIGIALGQAGTEAAMNYMKTLAGGNGVIQGAVDEGDNDFTEEAEGNSTDASATTITDERSF